MDQHPEHEHDRRRKNVGGEDASLVLHAENVNVHTERVAAGRVTLRKTVVTEEVSVPVTLRREQLDVIEEGVEDGGDSRLGTGADEASDHGVRGEGLRRTVRQLDDGDLEITLYAERPVVTVETVAVERVRVSRGVVTTTEQVTVDVAHEEAYVEEYDADGKQLGGHDGNAKQRDRH